MQSPGGSAPSRASDDVIGNRREHQEAAEDRVSARRLVEGEPDPERSERRVERADQRSLDRGEKPSPEAEESKPERGIDEPE